MRIVASTRKYNRILSFIPDLIRYPVHFWTVRSDGRVMVISNYVSANVSSLWIYVITLALLCFCFVAPSNAFKLPDTGQTKCYDINGVVISCANTGQDGAYTINPMSFTDNGDGTVTDNNTGLIWQKQDDGNAYTWYEASGVYDAMHNPTSQDVCGLLNLGGHSDWRLPTKKELITIVDYGVYSLSGPTINASYFPNTKSSHYWSSTSTTWGESWQVSFMSGYVGGEAKDYGNYVRCVRGEQIPGPNLIDNGNGTVTDNRTGLMWQQGEPGYMTWDSAFSYCEGLSLGGYPDWRVPNVKELESLTDDTRYPAIDTNFFPDAYKMDYWWSSTTITPYPDEAWFVYFFHDFCVGGNFKDTDSPDFSVRCVRGGQSIPCTSPNAPNLSSPCNECNSISTTPSLDWGDVSGATSYNVQICNDSNCSSKVKSLNVTNSQRTISSALNLGTTYYWRVRAKNSCGFSSWSSVWSFTTFFVEPPSQLTAKANSSSSIVLSWKDNSVDETGFKVYRKAGTGSWTLLTTTPANVESYSDTTATGNTSTTRYSYYIKACNSLGCSPQTNVAVIPYKPTGLTATPVSSTQINLKWTDKSNNETGFEIYRKSGVCSSTNSWSKIKTTGPNVSSYSNTGLASGETYSYKTRAYKKSAAVPYAYGYSLFSNCDDATTP